MRVKNVSRQMLENMRYEFLLNNRASNKFGIGKVPRISPGETVQIYSEAGAPLPKGSHQLEGRVFPEKREASRGDRLNNAMFIQFNVE